jgi:hypothetical protein
MGKFREWVVEVDGSSLDEALPLLKSVLEKTIANPDQAANVGARWAKWSHFTTRSVKRPHLEEIFNNGKLRRELELGGKKLTDLLSALDKVAHLPGSPGAFKSLSTNKESVKGVLAEILMGAKDMPHTAAIRKPFTTAIDGTTIRLPDGSDLDIPKGTDADVVSKETLWQIKVGEYAVDHPRDYEAWLRQAAEAVRAKSVPGGNKVGVRMDEPNRKLFGVDQNGAVERDTNYTAMWERVQAAYPDIVFVIDVIKYP